MIKLYNSLSHQIEEFKPIAPPKVTFYGCGPTVYDYIHIGNMRTFVLYDLLRRVLTANDYQVQMIQNITDIEDKIIKRSSEKGITPTELTTEFTQHFFNDLNALNILPADVYPKATEHVGKMVKYIEVLVEKGLAYTEKDGSVYFDISEFSDYGKLSQVQKRELKSGTRILSDEYSKDDAQDFALWKGVGGDEFGWDSPWGKGRPGWHIECSVMSQEYLGDTIDLHTGAVDLLFPHHENEIAQAEGKTGKKFVNYFLHGEHLLVDNKKMSKSLNNFYTSQDVKDRGFELLALRYLVMTAHYRDKLNFTWESLTAAQNALNNLRVEIRAWDQPDQIVAQFWQPFLEAANSDLGIPQAVALMWEMVRSDTPTSSKSATILKMDEILGLGLQDYVAKPREIPTQVQELLDQRATARQNQDFQKADELRDQIKELGFEVKDTPEGQKIV